MISAARATEHAWSCTGFIVRVAISWEKCTAPLSVLKAASRRLRSASVSASARVYAVVAAAAIAAAGVAVGGTLATPSAPPPALETQPGVPPLSLDFGLRNDLEAQALARAATLYDRGERDRAADVFNRYSSVEAQVGGALATWPEGTLPRLEELAREHPRSGVVRLNLGLAQFWEG